MPDACLLDGSLVEQTLWAAVHAGNCTVGCATSVACSAPSGSPGAYGPSQPGGYGGVTELSLGSLAMGPGLSSSADYMLSFGQFGECSAACGMGTEDQTLSCLSADLRLPAELSNCAYNTSDIEV